MSTKTSIKRIAAVAAVALTLGGFSAVSAFATANAEALAVSSAVATGTGAVGTAVTFSETVTATSAAAGDVFTVTPTLSFAPATGSTGATSAVKASSLVAGTPTLTNATLTSAATSTLSYTATAAGDAVAVESYTFTPDINGVYTFTFTPSGSTNATATTKTYVYTATASTGARATVAGALTNAPGKAATATVIGNGSYFPTVTVYAGTSDSAYLVSSTGVGTMYGTVTNSVNAAYVVYNSGTSAAGGFGVSKGATMGAGTLFVSGDYFSFNVNSAVAGTQTITITPVNGTTLPITETITWGAAPTVSAQYSTAYLGDGTTAATSASVPTGTYAATASNTAVANIAVQTNSAASTAITLQAITVAVSGPGVVSVDNGSTISSATHGKSIATTATSDSTGTFAVGIYPDGTAGTSTITITDGTVVLATKTVVFTGLAAKATASQNLYIAAAGKALGANPSHYALAGAVVGNGAADPLADTLTSGTAAIVGSVVDSNGNPVAGATVKLVSSNSAVITAGSCLELTAGTYAAAGTWQCQVSGASGALSGQTATVTFEVYNSTTAAYDILATPLTFAIGKATPASMTLTTDAASYAALAPMVITVTAKDSAGNLVADQDNAPLASLVSSVQLGGTLASPAALINGVAKMKKAYAPAVAGSFTISALDALSVAGEAVSVTATSAGSASDSAAQAAVDAANEATDAANAATDAANNAMDSADAAQQAALDAGDKADAALAAVTDLATKVSAIASQIAALSALVKKIAAKVKA